MTPPLPSRMRALDDDEILSRRVSNGNKRGGDGHAGNGDERSHGRFSRGHSISTFAPHASVDMSWRPQKGPTSVGIS